MVVPSFIYSFILEGPKQCLIDRRGGARSLGSISRQFCALSSREQSKISPTNSTVVQAGLVLLGHKNHKKLEFALSFGFCFCLQMKSWGGRKPGWVSEALYLSSEAYRYTWN